MARIAGVELPKDKRILIALTYIYGIGRSTSKKILEKLSIDLNKKVKDLAQEEVRFIIEELKKYKVEGELRSSLLLDIKRLISISCYRGIRHRLGLPVRGQRTKTNCRTKKGKRKTIANKKKATK